MSWLKAIDVAVFRAINDGLSNPVLDRIMPFFSWNSFFLPVLVFLGIWLIWKGGARGRLMLFMLVLILGLGDNMVIGTLKDAIGRLRPFHSIPDAHLLVGRGKSKSMPSSHAANWFAALMICYVYYRRSWRILLPLACLVCLSRIYVGVHYPGDVLVGAILGAGYACAGLVAVDFIWRTAGRRWFPLWHEALPSLLMQPDFLAREQGAVRTQASENALREQQWHRLAYLLVLAMLVGRWLYLAGGTIQLSEDEAYQWLWSKHLALSYYSKPPLIAYTQWLGTHIWGDSEFGVRFFSPLLGAISCLLLLSFLKPFLDARTRFLMIAIMLALPLLAVGSTVMTVDPLLVTFWTAAMVAGWRAAGGEGRLRDWVAVGFCMGLGLLSKYTALFQLLCWALFFVLWPPARAHLRRPGPYVAVLLMLAFLMPMLIWNFQHDWVTYHHVVYDNAELGEPWKFTLNYLFDFLGSEAGLLNPVFFIGMVWACIRFWKYRPQWPVSLYCFCMGAPLFLGYTAFSFHTRILPNWIAPAILPTLCLMMLFWRERWRDGCSWIVPVLRVGLVLGIAAMVLLHDTSLVRKVVGKPLPPSIDPLRRVRGWDVTARVVNEARLKLEKEGRETFIIGSHYGLTSQLSFYLPEAKKTVLTEKPLVYFKSSTTPKNQFYFWPTYVQSRLGQHAIYVADAKRAKPPPTDLEAQFESVRDLGLFKIMSGGQEVRQLQLFECRILR